jgi:hypothetical protein
MRKNAKLILGVCLAIGLIIALSGCASAGVSKYKDFGVLDKKVQESEQAVLKFKDIMFKTINGKPVKWQSKYDMRHFTGTIKLPAGTYEFLYDYHWETLSETTIGNTITLRRETRDIKDVKLTTELKPGNRYFISGYVLNDGTASTNLVNITNRLNGAFGDKVPKAPKVSTTPTVFEGEWVSPENLVYKFTGNTWETTIVVNDGYSMKRKGTFNITDKLNMYVTHQMYVSNDPKARSISNKWTAITIGDMYIYTYSFKDGNLLLEIEGFSPQGIFTKR